MTDFKKPVGVSLAFDHRRYRRLTTAAAGGSSISPQHANGHDRHKAEQQGPEAERGYHKGILRGFGDPSVSMGDGLDGLIGHCFPRGFLFVGHVIGLKL
jgi:hypothetical protein